jgi:hypothetical protein
MITITLLIILGAALIFYCGAALLTAFTGITMLIAILAGIFISMIAIFFSMLLMLLIFSIAVLSTLASLLFSFLVF